MGKVTTQPRGPEEPRYSSEAYYREVGRQARRAEKELRKAIRRVGSAVRRPDKHDSGIKIQFRCVEWQSDYFCSGSMTVKSHDRSCPIWKGEDCDCTVKNRTSVYAHRYPVFCQCSGCGYAPHGDQLTVLLGRIAANK